MNNRNFALATRARPSPPRTKIFPTLGELDVIVIAKPRWIHEHQGTRIIRIERIRRINLLVFLKNVFARSARSGQSAFYWFSLI